MLLKTSVSLACILICISAAPTRDCAGGTKDGDKMVRGRYWYVCNNGTYTMKGCISEKGVTLNPMDTFKNAAYVFVCSPDNNGEFVIKYSGCVSEDQQERKVGETWQDSNYWYTCVQDGERVKSQVQGCVDDGKRYEVGNSLEKGDLIYECSKNVNGNTGWDIYPNLKLSSVTYNPDLNHLQPQQTVPTYINT